MQLEPQFIGEPAHWHELELEGTRTGRHWHPGAFPESEYFRHSLPQWFGLGGNFAGLWADQQKSKVAEKTQKKVRKKSEKKSGKN